MTGKERCGADCSETISRLVIWWDTNKRGGNIGRYETNPPEISRQLQKRQTARLAKEDVTNDEGSMNGRIKEKDA